MLWTDGFLKESFEETNILVIQEKVNSQTISLVSQLLKIEEQYECLAELIGTMKSAKYTIKEVVQAIQELDFEEYS